MKIQSNAMDRIRQLQNRSLRETVGLQEAPSTPAENKAKADEFVRKQAEKLAARTAEREKIIKQTPRVLGTNAAVNASNKTSDQIRTGLDAVKTVVKDIVAPPGQKIADKPTRVEPTLDVDKKLSSGDNKSTRVEPTLDVDKKPESKTGSASEKGTPFNKVLNPNNPSTEPGSLRNKVNAAKAASAASEVKSPRLKRFSIGAGLAMMVPAAIELYQNRNKDKEKPAEPEPAKPAASAPALPAAPATNARANFAATDSRKDAMAANVEPVKAKQVRPDNGDSGSSGSVAGKKIDANTPQYKQPTTPPAEKQEPAAPPPPTPPAPVKATPPPPPAPAAVTKPTPPPVKADDINPDDDISPEAKAAGERMGVNPEMLRAQVVAAKKEKKEKEERAKYSGQSASESVQSKARSASFVFERIRNITEGRPSQRHPLEGHDYHKKSNDELIYIAKDAHKAAEAMKGHNTKAENKYRDQANDSATVRYYRQKSGMPDWYKKKYGHLKEESVPVPPETKVVKKEPEPKVVTQKKLQTGGSAGGSRYPWNYESVNHVTEAKEKTEYDYEGDMARGQLQSIISNAQRVHDMLEDNDNLAEWVQSKITLAEDYISTVANYMMSEVDEEVQMNESFSAPHIAALSQSRTGIAALKAAYSKINGIDPASDTYKKLIAMLDGLDLKSLQSLAGAEVKFVSKLAQNRVARRSMKKEEVEQIDELSSELLGRYKKSSGAQASAADKSGDYAKANKRFSGIMKATKKQFANDTKPVSESDAAYGASLRAKEEKRKMSNISGADKSKLSSIVSRLNREKKKLPQGANDTKQGVAEGATGAKPGFMLRQDPALAKKLKDQLARKKKLPQGADFATQRRKERLASNGRMDEAVESHQEEWIDEAGPGLWANIHAKRQRIKQGSKERMRNPGEKGAPESGALEKARGTNEEVKGEYERKVDKYLKKKYAPDANKPPFDAPYAKMPKADKSGAVHSPMSRAKHLAKMAGRKQAGIKENSHDGQDNINTPAKRSLSKTAGMVKSILNGAKSKNKNLDKFESDPELSSQIVKQE